MILAAAIAALTVALPACDTPPQRLDVAAVSSAILGKHLFLAREDGTIEMRALAEPERPRLEVQVSPGRLTLAAAPPWLAVAEDGVGLRLLRPRTAHGGHAGHGTDPQRMVTEGFVPLEGRFEALAAAGGVLHAAVAGRGIARIELGDRTRLRVASVLPWSEHVRAMAASGSRLFLLGDRGLDVVDLGREPSPVVRLDVVGSAIDVAGRSLRIATADGGVVRYRDVSGGGQVHDVTIGDNFFQPATLVVDVGDTVRWTHLAADLHNVFSCTADQIGCGEVASETFTSGQPDTFFVYEHTFSIPGRQPYLCQPHATFMQGLIEVVDAAGDPPVVGDGSQGDPLRVGKLAADGSSLELSWDASCPGAADHTLLYGVASGLPASPGGTYAPSGAVCDVGPTSPFAWHAVPAGPGLLWWILVATDGATTEGPWGPATGVAERSGPGVVGSSGQCGVTAKSLSNPCGQ